MIALCKDCQVEQACGAWCMFIHVCPCVHPSIRKVLHIQALMCDTTMRLLTSVETPVRSLTQLETFPGSLTGDLVTSWISLLWVSLAGLETKLRLAWVDQWWNVQAGTVNITNPHFSPVCTVHTVCTKVLSLFSRGGAWAQGYFRVCYTAKKHCLINT